MKRRGFLGFLGGAAVAGPSMAKAAVTPVTEALSVPGVGMAGLYGGPQGGSIAADDTAGEIFRLKGMLTKFLGKSPAELARDLRAVSVYALDPDLAAMRSMSLDFRMRKQRERNFARQREDERGWIERRIQELLTTTD